MLVLLLLLSFLQSSNDIPSAMHAINPRIPASFEIDERRVAAVGIRKLTSQHLILYTDVRNRAEIDELVAVFDLAVPQWCDHFSIDPARANAWRMRAYVMADPEKFRQADLIPHDLPDFAAGYQRGHDFWLYVQPGDYYSRHLMLHEGTHAFMEWFVGGLGAPWYAEGMAELLALHQWQPATENQPAQLTMQHHISNRDETPYWGRPKVIREAWANRTALSLTDVLNIPARSFRDVENYGWAWAGCEFLSQHELSRERFLKFDSMTARSASRFNAQVNQALQPHLKILERDWLLFISEHDYGSEVSKSVLTAATQPKTTSSTTTTTQTFNVQADRGWQSTTIQVQPNQRWSVRCESKFSVGQTVVNGETKPWHCTADGITLDYYRAIPLGKLLAGVYDASGKTATEEVAHLLEPLTAGCDVVIEVKTAGVLCLRINDSPARMGDNQGVLEVTLKQLE